MVWSYSLPDDDYGVIYAKPVVAGAGPVGTDGGSPDWTDDVVSAGAKTGGAIPFTGLVDGQSYWLFEQQGGSPSDTDNTVVGRVGVLNPPLINQINSDTTQQTLQSNASDASTQTSKTAIRQAVQGRWINADQPSDEITFTIQDPA